MRRFGRHGYRGDFYHYALTVSWGAFAACAVALYLAANLLFALAYLAEPGAITHARPGSFSDAFFFSVQTMATVGYGQLAPATFYANVLVTAETIVGAMLFAIGTGLVFARVSRPTSRVMFARHAVISDHNGTPTLAVRLANERHNQILEAEVSLTLVRNEVTAGGELMRHFHDLTLVRSHTPIFELTFTVMHPIDRASPLYRATRESLAANHGEILVTVTGLDETLSQTIHARYSYRPHEILFGRHFASVFGFTPEGQYKIDFDRFHETEAGAWQDERQEGTET